MNRRALLATLPAILGGCAAVHRPSDRRTDAPEVKAIVDADHDPGADVVTFAVERATGFRPGVVDQVYVETPDGERRVWVDADDAAGGDRLVEDGEAFAVDAEAAGTYRLLVDYADDSTETVALEQVEVEP